ncbi:hypothetical protein VTJ04DRAFT_690 [Mycothermus thermophilus]|uniref:uncharacterized protein n=1 Tax=Humicola insolens TaxID=85995 RepID=UPI00374287BB
MYQFFEDVPYEFRLVGEGAANCVFEVRGYPQTEAHRYLQDKLLRVAKAGTKAYRHEELQEYWETVVRPLFEPQHLVRQELVRLGGRGIVSRLNAVLAQEEPRRRVDFRGSRVAEAEYGMLVEDMRQASPGVLTLEFKPKWLSQSPTAPESATRCRTCARELLKRKKRMAGTGVISSRSLKADETTSPNVKNTHILCPFNFITCRKSQQSLATLLAHLLPRCNPPGVGPPSVSEIGSLPPQHLRLADWLQTNTLLPRLHAVQLAYSPSPSPTPPPSSTIPSLPHSSLSPIPSPTSSSSSTYTVTTTTTPTSPNFPPSSSSSSTAIISHPNPPPSPPTSASSSTSSALLQGSTRRKRGGTDARDTLTASSGEDEDEEARRTELLSLAMTLRDCTVFVRVPVDPSQPVQAKLADLDRKRGVAKRSYWRDLERRLIQEGYYNGHDKEKELGVVVDCLLGRLGEEVEGVD